MQKTIFITGATEGIGLETARMLVSMGHNVLIHGRNQDKCTFCDMFREKRFRIRGIEGICKDIDKASKSILMSNQSISLTAMYWR